VSFVIFLFVSLVVAFAGQEPLPRFRSGANLVTVDAYFTNDGKPVTDLTQDEIEILEDNRPQTIEGFRVVHAKGQGAVRTQPELNTVDAMRAAATDADARLFVLFYDTWHVSFDGSSKAAAPISELLNRIVGSNDLVGVTTPELPARGLSLTHRTEGIERATRDTLNWSQRDRVGSADPREQEFYSCYPDNDLQRPQFRGVAKEIIERRREQKTLRALDELIGHLATLSEERKFVVLLSEGWVLFRQNPALGAVLEPGSLPSVARLGPPVAGAPGGTATVSGYDRGFASCERERSLLAFVDHSLEIRQLAQRANRANVTFYIVDPRGLAAFDDSIGPMQPARPMQDRERMASRQGGLRELAFNTDGAVVLNTSDVKGGIARMMADLCAYYLMQYYSTNTRLDGRFRPIAVRVKRPGVQVRARPGYLAPTEAEAHAAGVPAPTVALPPGTERIVRRQPITALRRGPSTGLKYVIANEPQFRRTERLRIELPVPAEATGASGRVLTSQGQPLPLVVSYSTQQTNGQLFGIADVALAPLAVGEYVLELAIAKNGKTERVSYGFRIIP
jgi:VWFA-related protein